MSAREIGGSLMTDDPQIQFSNNERHTAMTGMTASVALEESEVVKESENIIFSRKYFPVI